VRKDTKNICFSFFERYASREGCILFAPRRQRIIENTKKRIRKISAFGIGKCTFLSRKRKLIKKPEKSMITSNKWRLINVAPASIMPTFFVFVVR
jgi:hypothetical protein